MWIVRAAIEPMVWAFTCDKSKTGNCLPSGFTHDEEDAKKYKTYEGAVRAEMKLRKEKGLTHNQTETSGEKETTTMTPKEKIFRMMSRAEKRKSKSSFYVCVDVVGFLSSKLTEGLSDSDQFGIAEQIHFELQKIAIPGKGE
jgi:hypothetical protein